MGYRIKTVSELTGVPRNTLLAWERRYGLVTPSRQDNGYREYSDRDVACLQSVKQLMDQGFKVSEAVDHIKMIQQQGVPGQLRVAVVHATLSTRLETSSGLHVAHAAADLAGFLASHRAQEADLVVAALDALGADPLASLRAMMEATGAAQALVTYQFATHATLQRLVAANVRLLQGTPQLSVVCQTIAELSALHQLVPQRSPVTPAPLPEADDEAAPRRFDDEQLDRLREIRSGVGCECPNHIATLVSALLAFEAYSRDCESQSPQDAALHRYLSQTTGSARQLLEDMLEAVIVQDQIQL